MTKHRDHSSSEGWAGRWAEEILWDGVNKEENNPPEISVGFPWLATAVPLGPCASSASQGGSAATVRQRAAGRQQVTAGTDGSGDVNPDRGKCCQPRGQLVTLGVGARSRCDGATESERRPGEWEAGKGETQRVRGTA